MLQFLFVNAGHPQKAESATLQYARPGTVARKRNWRPGTGIVLWLMAFTTPLVLLLHLQTLQRRRLLFASVVVTAVFAMIAWFAGLFIFPRSWRLSAIAILIMIAAVLLPIVMLVRAG